MKYLIIFYLFTCLSLAAQENTLEKARELYNKKSYDESLSVLEEMAKEPNVDSSAYVLMSYNYWAQGKQSEAIDVLYVALKKKQNLPEIYIELIKAYSSSGKYKGAGEICDTALEKFPNNTLLKLQKAYLLARYGKVMTALGIVEELKTNAPNDPRPLNLEAQIYLLKGEFDKAELSMKWASSLDQTNPNFKNNLALIYEKIYDRDFKKDKNKALESLKLAESELESAIQIKKKPVFETNLLRVREKLNR